MKKFFAITLFSIFCFSCALTETKILKDNISGVLAKHKVSTGDMSCESVVRNRSGVCSFAIKNDQVDLLTKAIELSSELDERERLQNMNGVAKCGKASLTPDNKELKLYRSKAKISLENGQAFQSLNLFYDPKMEEGCIEVQYSYG